MKKKIIAALLVVALALALVLPTVPAGASPGWYDGDWGKRSPVTIDNTGNSNTLTDYQVRIDVAYDSDMQPDFDDLRFTDSDGSTELNYWIEEKTDSISAKAWVKDPSIPGSSTKTIYMYYGNPAAASASNGDNTFLFFDDFSGATLDTSKWDNLSDGSGTATIVNGKLRLDSPSGAYNHARVKTKMSFGDVSVQHKWWLVTWPVCPTIVDNNHAWTNFGVYKGDHTYISIARMRNHYCQTGLNARAWLYSRVAMGATVVSSALLEDCTLMEGTFKLDRYGTTVHTYYNDTLHLSYDSAFTDSSQLWFDVYGSFMCPPTAADYDDVLVRQYTLPEPTTSVGTEVEGIEIDIKPSSDPNSINLKGKGVIPVAILGSETFDVTDVDVNSLHFGKTGTEASPAHDLTDPVVYNDHLQDVNGDGFTDLVSHYRTQATGIVSGETSATLTGQTTGGVPITGTDTVNIVPEGK